MGWTGGPTQTTRRIWELHAKGYRTKWIATELSLSAATVRNAIYRGRLSGELHKAGPRSESPRAKTMRAYLKFGSMVNLFGALSPKQQQWLIDECIRYGAESYEEMVLEMVRDAYEVAQQEEKG